MAVAEVVETRECRTCGEERPLTREFFTGNGYDRSGNPVLKYSCRECTRKASRLRGRPKPEREPEEPVEHCAGRLLPSLPTPPLLAKLMALVAQRNSLEGLSNDTTSHSGVGNIGALCKQLGFAERTLLAWREGERKTTKFDTVDRILTRTGWLWFDVYNERTVVFPDGSTDWETLRRVEHDFTCEGCKACEDAARKSELARQYAMSKAVAA